MKSSLLVCAGLILLIGTAARAQDPNDPVLIPEAETIVFDFDDQTPGDVSGGLVLMDPATGVTVFIERFGAPMELIDIGPAFGSMVLSPFGDPAGISLRMVVLDLGVFGADPGPHGLGWGLAKIQMTMSDFVPSDTDGYYGSYSAARNPMDPDPISGQWYTRDFEGTLSGDQTIMEPGFWSAVKSWWAAYPIQEFFIKAGSPDEPNSVFYDNIKLTITPRDPNLPYSLPGGSFAHPDFIAPFPFLQPNTSTDLDFGRVARSDAPESDAGGGGQYMAANGPTGGNAAWIPLILLRDAVAAEPGLHHGIRNALLAKLESALGSLFAGKVKSAMNSLGAFINLLEAQSGKKVPVELAALWIGQAQGVINLLTPSCTNCGKKAAKGSTASASAPAGATTGTQAVGGTSSGTQAVGGSSSGGQSTGGSSSGGSSKGGASGDDSGDSGSGDSESGSSDMSSGGSGGIDGSGSDYDGEQAGASAGGTEPQGDDDGKGKGPESKFPDKIKKK